MFEDNKQHQKVNLRGRICISILLINIPIEVKSEKNTLVENPSLLSSIQLTRKRRCWWSTGFNYWVNWILYGWRCKSMCKICPVLANGVYSRWSKLTPTFTHSSYVFTSTNWTSMLVWSTFVVRTSFLKRLTNKVVSGSVGPPCWLKIARNFFYISIVFIWPKCVMLKANPRL